MLLIPWVIPPAMSTLVWLWMFDSSYSAFNWLLEGVGGPRIPWLGETGWARFSIILVNVWYGAPFFMIMYLAALKSVPEQLYEAARIEGAGAPRQLLSITLPMLRPTSFFLVITGFINNFNVFEQVNILTSGGPMNATTTIMGRNMGQSHMVMTGLVYQGEFKSKSTPKS
jgi:multiple sugar transport system permease protein